MQEEILDQQFYVVLKLRGELSELDINIQEE